jgi:transposase
MGKRSIIWENNLEKYVLNLHYEQRKSYKKIAEIIKKEKDIQISSEAVRTFINRETLHVKTHDYTL